MNRNDIDTTNWNNVQELPIGVIFPYYEISVPKSDRVNSIFGHYLDKEVGLALAKNTGYYGAGGTAYVRYAIKLANGRIIRVNDDNIDLAGGLVCNSNKDQALREKTLNSLSDEQKRVLGL